MPESTIVNEPVQNNAHSAAPQPERSGQRKLGVYMDHNATTPLAAEALEAMTAYLTWNFGNPSSIHEFGIQARYGVEKARLQVARLVNAAEPEDIIFTGCGSESDNIAIRCLAGLHPERRHIITSAVEHKAILEACHHMEARGFEVTYLPVDADCKVSVKAVAEALRPDTLIVSIMYANNESGVLQPISEIAKLCRERGVLFHTDAVQAVGREPIDVQALGVDLLSMSAHKLYGPKGIGALYVRPGLQFRGLLLGGSQERGFRAGTENVAGIVAFGAAAKLAGKVMADETTRLTELRRDLYRRIQAAIPDALINGHEDDRLPGTLNLRFKGILGQRLVTEMSARAVAISAGSACTAIGTSHSHVLIGMGLSKDDAAASVRISLGRSNTPEDVDYVMSFLPGLIATLRAEFIATGGARSEVEC